MIPQFFLGENITDPVVVERSYLVALIKSDEELSRLEAYGVDNWQGYYEALNDTEGLFIEND